MSATFGAVPAEFLDRARHEAERYGADAWIFLRELVQNSRDAGATSIAFEVTLTDTHLQVSCTDDGSGMSRTDIERYLLRLYASKKAPHDDEQAQDRAQGTVGRFGVGFWSVLLFRPTDIVLQSASTTGQTGFALDLRRRELNDLDTKPNLATSTGTVVTLRRRRVDGDSVAAVAHGLKKYAGAISGLAGRRAPQLTLNRQPIAESLLDKAKRHGHFGSNAIEGKDFEGAVGLGRRPVVRLYAHGLLIREASDLDELLPRKNMRSVALPGLHPVVHINANGLDVLMNRQAVVEDELLEAVVSRCATEVWMLQKQILDKVAPISLLPRLKLYLAQPARLTALLAVILVVSSAAVAAGIVIGVEGSDRLAGPKKAFARFVENVSDLPISSTASSTTSPTTTAAATSAAAMDAIAPRAPTPPRFIDDLQTFSNSVTVNDLDNQQGFPDWAFSYVGPPTVFFRGNVLDGYDPKTGFFPHSFTRKRGKRAAARRQVPARPRSRTNSVVVTMTAAKGNRALALPTPFGHAIDPKSVSVDGARANVERSPTTGSTHLVTSRPDTAIVAYSTYAVGGESRMAVPAGSVRWPSPWRKMINAAKRIKSVRSRAEKVRRFVMENIRYSTSRADARRFLVAKGDWFDRVMNTGVGDCDVINGLIVLALWETNLPARLAVGLVGHGGEVSPVMHAWAEVFDNRSRRWVFVDATPPQVVARLASEVAFGPDVVAGRHAADGHGRDGTGVDDAIDDAIDNNVANEAATGSVASNGKATMTPRPASVSRPAWISRPVIVAAALGFLLMIAGVFFLAAYAIRGRRRDENEEDPILDELVEHMVRHRGGPDPLGLRLRPFFRTLRRGDLSLARAERAAANDQLFAAAAANPWASVVRGVVLDIKSERTQMLATAVSLTDLTPLAGVDDLDATPSDPALARVSPLIRNAISEVRLRSAPGTGGVHEVAVRTARGGRIFIFVDVDVAAKELEQKMSEFSFANWLVQRASVLTPHRLTILGALAAGVVDDAVHGRPILEPKPKSPQMLPAPAGPSLSAPSLDVG